MVQFPKFRLEKQSFVLYLLLALVTLEFIGLAGFLISSSQARAAAGLSDPPDAVDAVPVQPAPAVLQPVEKPKPDGELTGPEILAQNQIIAHGLGSLDGVTVLNCREGFEAMYRQGVRVFEVDLRLTRDAKLVLRHDWRAGWQEGISESSVPTQEEFLSKPVLGKYTPLSFRDLLFLMREYQDICIVTDTKFTDAEIVRMQFDAMMSEAASLGLSYLLDRFVVQIYNVMMFQVADSVHHFPGYLYTLYQEKFDGTEEGFREAAVFCTEQKDILGITVSEERWNPVYAEIAAEYGLKIYTHTINDPGQARGLLESGVSGIYTDVLAPDSLIPAAPETQTEPVTVPATPEGEM